VAKQQPKNRDQRTAVPLLRLADQATVAVLVALALASMGVYWFTQGGHRGALIEIDRAQPLQAQFQVELNSAPWPELAQMPGIGETLARRIVASRETDGPFLDHEQLQRVHGIGPRTLDRVRPYLLPMPSARNVASQ